MGSNQGLIDSKMQTQHSVSDAREMTHRDFPLPAGAVMVVKPIDVSPQPGCEQDKDWMVLSGCQPMDRKCRYGREGNGSNAKRGETGSGLAVLIDDNVIVWKLFGMH